MKGGNRARWYCRACDKTSFASEARAEETISRALAFPGERKPKRAYPCPYGNGWHLTSQEALH